MKYRHGYWKRRGIKSVPTHWLYGNMKDAIFMKSAPGIVFGDLYQQGGDSDLMGIYIFHKPFLLLRNSEIIKQIMIKDFNIFPDHYFTAESITDKVGSSNLFTIKNPEWRYLRLKMSPAFTSGKLKKLFYLMVETGETMKEYFQKEFSDGSKTKTVLVKDIFTKYTTDIISSLAFGVRTNSFETSEFYNQSLDATRITFFRGVRFSFMFFFPNFGKYLGGSILGGSTDYFRKVFWNSMDSREVTKAKRGDIIDSLLELKNQPPDSDRFKFEGDALLSQSAMFFVAGRETSITTLTFTLAELAKRPDIQKRMREEIKEKLEKYGMTYEGVQDMKYLFQVVSEVLRLYPPAPLIERTAIEDYKIQGSDLVIKKGTPVYVALYGLHRDPKYHPDPTRFDPDRFSDERKNDMLPCTYMPFGDGPRNCVGLRVGLLQIAVGLITILRDYEISPDPSSDCHADARNVFLSPSPEFTLKFNKI